MVQPLFGLLQCYQPGGLPLDLLFSNSTSDQVGICSSYPVENAC